MVMQFFNKYFLFIVWISVSSVFATLSPALKKCIQHQQWYCAYKKLTPQTPVGVNDLVLWHYYAQTKLTRNFDNVRIFIATHPKLPDLNKLRKNLERIMPHNLSAKETLHLFKTSLPLTVVGDFRYIQALLYVHRYKQAKQMINWLWENKYMLPRDEKYFYHRFRRYLYGKALLTRFELDLIYKKRKQMYWLLKQMHGSAHTIALYQYRLYRGWITPITLLKHYPLHTSYDPGVIYQISAWYFHHKKNYNAYQIFLNLKNVKPTFLMNKKLVKEQLYIAHKLIYTHQYHNAYKLLSIPLKSQEKLFLLGWLSLQHLNKPKVALYKFSTYYKKATNIKERIKASYWIGRTYEKLKQPTLANKWFVYAAHYPTIYYGQVAFMKLSPTHSIVLPIKNQNLSNREHSYFENTYLIHTINDIKNAGLTKFSYPFLIHLAKQSNNKNNLYLASEWASEVNRPDWSIRISRIALKKNIILIRYAYPLIDESTISLANFKTPMWLIHAIIRQESSFNTRVVSTAKAHGLMQLIPSTAKFVSNKLIGVKYKRKQLIQDPSFNVKMGASYLDYLVDQFHSYTLGIAAYNAGPTNVKEWVRQYKMPLNSINDYIDWIETIPFSETRHYVKQVIRDSAVYHALMPAPNA